MITYYAYYAYAYAILLMITYFAISLRVSIYKIPKHELALREDHVCLLSRSPVTNVPSGLRLLGKKGASFGPLHSGIEQR